MELVMDGQTKITGNDIAIPIGSMYGIYANIGGILMVNVTIYIYSIHGSYGIYCRCSQSKTVDMTFCDGLF